MFVLISILSAAPSLGFVRPGKEVILPKSSSSVVVLRADTVDAVETTPVPLPEGPKKTSADAIICGGGPAGLLSAIMLAQKFPDVSFARTKQTFERSMGSVVSHRQRVVL